MADLAAAVRQGIEALAGSFAFEDAQFTPLDELMADKFLASDPEDWPSGELVYEDELA